MVPLFHELFEVPNTRVLVEVVRVLVAEAERNGSNFNVRRVRVDLGFKAGGDGHRPIVEGAAALRVAEPHFEREDAVLDADADAWRTRRDRRPLPHVDAPGTGVKRL